MIYNNASSVFDTLSVTFNSYLGFLTFFVFRVFLKDIINDAKYRERMK